MKSLILYFILTITPISYCFCQQVLVRVLDYNEYQKGVNKVQYLFRINGNFNNPTGNFQQVNPKVDENIQIQVYSTLEVFRKEEVLFLNDELLKKVIKKYESADSTLKREIFSHIDESLTDLEVGEDKLNSLKEDILNDVRFIIEEQKNNITEDIKSELKTELVSELRNEIIKDLKKELLSDKKYLKQLRKELRKN